MEIGPSNTDVPEYNLSPGCSAAVEGNLSPLSFFSLLITNSMLQSKTNLYAQQFIAPGPHSRARSWEKRVFDVAELLLFLAKISYGNCALYTPRSSHWSTLWPYSNTQFSSVSSHYVFVGKEVTVYA